MFSGDAVDHLPAQVRPRAGLSYLVMVRLESWTSLASASTGPGGRFRASPPSSMIWWTARGGPGSPVGARGGDSSPTKSSCRRWLQEVMWSALVGKSLSPAFQVAVSVRKAMPPFGGETPFSGRPGGRRRDRRRKDLVMSDCCARALTFGQSGRGGQIPSRAFPGPTTPPGARKVAGELN